MKDGYLSFYILRGNYTNTYKQLLKHLILADLEEWIAHQEEVYEKGFRQRESLLKSEGTKSGIHPRKVGYTFIYRHPDEISAELAEISSRLSSVIGCVPYSLDSIHVCALDECDEYKISVNETENAENHLDTKVTTNLCDIARKTTQNTPAPRIQLNNLLFNPEAVIIEGIPIDSSSYDFSKSLFNACQKDETSRRMSRFPWGVHTTLIRNSGGLSPEQLEETGFYQALLKERKKFTPKTTRFKSLDVCFFDCGPKEARFRVLERFEL